MSFPADDTITNEELSAAIATAQAEIVWDDASDSELEARISKDDSSNGTNYC